MTDAQPAGPLRPVRWIAGTSLRDGQPVVAWGATPDGSVTVVSADFLESPAAPIAVTKGAYRRGEQVQFAATEPVAPSADQPSGMTVTLTVSFPVSDKMPDYVTVEWSGDTDRLAPADIGQAFDDIVSTMQGRPDEYAEDALFEPVAQNPEPSGGPFFAAVGAEPGDWMAPTLRRPSEVGLYTGPLPPAETREFVAPAGEKISVGDCLIFQATPEPTPADHVWMVAR